LLVIQDSAHNIKRISDVKIQWGEKKPLMNTLITSPGRMHRLNLARILVIYFAPEGVGKFDVNQKRQLACLLACSPHFPRDEMVASPGSPARGGGSGGFAVRPPPAATPRRLAWR
jgi:hypothetical protein